MKSNDDVNVTSKISQLEKQFNDLHWSILTELKANEDITIDKLLHTLTLLPLNLRKEYQEAILNKLPSLPRKGDISELFLHLNPLFSFLDYGLLQYIIDRFGSSKLNEEMLSYCCDIRTFMSQTTIQQLVGYFPHEEDVTPNVSKVIAEIDKNPCSVKLSELDNLRREICIRARLSDVVCALVKARPSHSFTVVWRLPSILAPQVVEAMKQTEQSFFVKEKINSLFVDDLQLYNNCSSLIIAFGSELKQRYQVVPTTVSHADWITSPTEKIFKLAMIQREQVQHGQLDDRFVQMTISGRIDKILQMKVPIELQNIFKGGDRRIILIEGVPGSGKSTLTINICQKWGKGELFQQFTVVILVQLRDPAVQRAQTIADLLPVQNAEEIATELLATNGRGVLWVLDGWDELLPHLQQESIFRTLLPPNPSKETLERIRSDVLYAEYVRMHYSDEKLWAVYLKQNPQYNQLLLKSSVIVTSRPISSGDLHPVVSSRIEVLGFTPEEQRQYFTECLKGDTKALEALLEKIQENPVVQSICYLPLNAAFIVHTFKYRDQSLPNTEYEIYLSVILSCIQCHYDREGRGHDLPRELASLDDLSRSEAVREPFQCLCELAYRGVMENKVTFSSSDLPQGSNTLSLLQAIESFLQSGKSVFYNFLHVSVQGVLSAHYITTKLSDSEQVSQFQQLFNQPRFAAVFQFYAAITKLKSPGIHQVIDRVVEAKSKPLLVSLLRCLHEAQDPALCLYVAKRLEYRLDLSETSLSPLDCLSVSFFLSSLSGKETNVDLYNCTIGDLGAKCLSKYSGGYISKISIDIVDNEIHEEGALHIARMLHFIEHLYLSGNPIGDTGASLISETIRETAALKTLILNNCSITSSGAEDLSRALAQNGSLKKLDIGRNDLGDDGISHVAEALKQNKQLKELWISRCGMTDKGAVSLASALTVNKSLKMLHMGGGKRALTKDGLSTIAHSLANKSMFVKLAIPYDSGSTTAGRLSREVNEARKRNGLPPVEIKGEYCCVDVSYQFAVFLHDMYVTFV